MTITSHRNLTATQDAWDALAAGDVVPSFIQTHETGTATDGAVFDNRALWISRFNPDGLVDAVWTIDLDHEQMVAFWANHGHTALP